MSLIYLSRVELNDFRTFGNFALDIPSGPGLILLVGTNGLGKSSFFDGIEWCLTDRVSRFANHISRLKEGAYLTRRDASPDSHKVSLHFSTGESITRTAKVKPSEASLVNLLKKSNWGEIKDLGTYLAFTHFLGQAAQQRFTSRKHNEQWEALKGPSGIDRLEEIRTTLRGRTTSNAFRRRIDEQQMRVSQAEKALQAWRDASERFLRLHYSATASGGMPRQDFEASLGKLAVNVRTLLGTAVDFPTIDAGEHLTFIRQSIEAELVATRAAIAQLEPLRTIVDRFLLLNSQSDPTEALIAAARARVAEATISLSKHILASGAAKEAVSAQASVVSRQFELVERLTAVRQLIEERVRFDAEWKELVSESSGLQCSREAQELKLAEARSALTQAIQIQSKRLDLESRQNALNQILERAGEIGPLESAANMTRQTSSAAEELAIAAKTKIVDLSRQIAELEGRISEGNTRLAELTRKASDMANALSRIASHIGEHDATCPVCASPFEPGVLKALATAAATSEDEGLAIQARINNDLVHELDLKREALTQSKTIIAAATIDAQEAAVSQSKLAAARTDIARSLEVSAELDLLEIVTARIAEIHLSLAELLADSAVAPSVAVAQAEIETIDAELAALRRRSKVVEERQLAVSGAILRNDERKATIGIAIPNEVELVEEIESHHSQVAIARDRLSELESHRAATLSAETSAREFLASVQAELDRIGATIAAARRDMDVTVSQWTHASLPGVPSQQGLAARSDALARRAADLTQALDNQSDLARSHEAILAQSELQIVINDLERQGGPGSASEPTAHERQLQELLSEARDVLQTTESTQAAVNAYAQQLQNEADDFSTKFLAPLNDLIDDFNRALLSTPGETVQFSTDLSIDRTQLGMQLRYADQVDNAIYNTALPPQLVLSEGQMAANGFSILCAASTAYQWSNWRSLLLDDPLQHNDVIHAAAFVDVMRNLVELQDYQLIMSSHDRAESEFLARKFDAAGLPCTVVALTAPSKEGVLFEAPRYNSAAIEQMQSRRAQTG